MMEVEPHLLALSALVSKRGLSQKQTSSQPPLVTCLGFISLDFLDVATVACLDVALGTYAICGHSPSDSELRLCMALCGGC